MIIGLTGGIGTGKSESVNYFIKYGAEIIDCDLIARECSNLKEVITKIEEEFGKGIIKTGKIDRKKLREEIFEDKEKLKKLNEIMHPEILKMVRKEIEMKQKKYNFIIVDMPLLFEVGFEKEVDKTLVICSPFEVQLERVMKRDGVDYKSALAAIKAQMSMADKIKRADYVIENGGTKKELGEKIFEFIVKLKEGI